MGLRRKGRELAVQTLYGLNFAEVTGEFQEYSLLNQYPDLMYQLFKNERVTTGTPLASFCEELIKNTIINLEEIEEQIAKHLANWSMENLAPLDRSILQVAIYELLYTDTPAAVVINEAIEISKKFCSENSGKFLNGILDAINREIKEASLADSQIRQ